MLQLMVEALKEKKYSIEDNQNVSYTRFYHAIFRDEAEFLYRNKELITCSSTFMPDDVAVNDGSFKRKEILD